MTVNYQLMRSNRKSFRFRLQLFIKYLLRIVTGKTKEKFTYDVCYSSPKLCPVDVFEIDFISDSGTLSAAFGSASACGMGHGMNRLASSRDRKYYLPRAIEAVWISEIDRKVYSVAALLPYDEIVSLFKRHKELQRLDLCLLPEGNIILYVKGTSGRILLNWIVSAYEEDNEEILEYIYCSRASSSMKDYFDSIFSEELHIWQRYLREKGNLSSLISLSLQRFNYELNFEFEDESTHNLKIWTSFMNKEIYPRYNKDIIMPSRLKELYVLWDSCDFHYTSWMYFNEDEIIRAFDEAYGDDRMQKGELKIKVSKDNSLFDISLNVGEKSIKLENTEIRVFQDPIDDPNGDGTLIYKNYKGNHKNLFFDEDGYFEA